MAPHIGWSPEWSPPVYVLVVVADEVNLDVKRKLHLGRVIKPA